jgi:type I restriction enzyme R subunit
VGKGERYYQEIAVNRAVEGIFSCRRRQLLTMATGTGEHRRPRILYLADRNILVDQPKDGIFALFGDARCKIEGGEAVKSREMYFAIYQALAGGRASATLTASAAPSSTTSTRPGTSSAWWPCAPALTSLHET